MYPGNQQSKAFVMGNKTESASRDSVAVEVMRMAETLAERAQTVANEVNDKLHLVMTTDYPRAEKDCGPDSVEFPPLFAALRNQFQLIGNALDNISQAMDRTEL